MSAVAVAAGASERVRRAWQVLDTVLDPEVPALSLCELGIVREVIDHGDALEVALTPTYSGCPATEVIAQSVLEAITREGLGPASIVQRRAPAWTTDWISETGRRKLREYGIAPPGPVDPQAGIGIKLVGSLAGRLSAPQPTVLCPRCDSPRTERLSPFGSTACKSLYRCMACREPFEHFKPI